MDVRPINVRPMATLPRARGQRRGTLVAHIRVAYWYSKFHGLDGGTEQADSLPEKRKRLCIAETSRLDHGNIAPCGGVSFATVRTAKRASCGRGGGSDFDDFFFATAIDWIEELTRLQPRQESMTATIFYFFA